MEVTKRPPLEKFRHDKQILQFDDSQEERKARLETLGGRRPSGYWVNLVKRALHGMHPHWRDGSCVTTTAEISGQTTLPFLREAGFQISRSLDLPRVSFNSRNLVIAYCSRARKENKNRGLFEAPKLT